MDGFSFASSNIVLIIRPRMWLRKPYFFFQGVCPMFRDNT